MIKRCNKLTQDRTGKMYCRSTHVCYKTVCMEDIFMKVEHHFGGIVVTPRNN